MAAGPAPPERSGGRQALGSTAMAELLTELVSIAPTNLEAPAEGRYEKPHYVRAVERLARAARAVGLTTRVFDPLVDLDDPGPYRNIPRPNLIADLDQGARRTVLILAHYDVVPVPAAQRPAWRSPPHTLTARADGRLYGRGANDDLGSGVVASLLALERLQAGDPVETNVRLLVCCDEETGGEGGIEAIHRHDHGRPAGDPERIVRGDVALIPDGSPETTAGSSGVLFLDALADRPLSAAEAATFGSTLVGYHERARQWTSVYRSPDWPDHGAPSEWITGRATVTQVDLASDAGPSPTAVRLARVHAESEATNQIPEFVTFVFDGPASALAALPGRLAPHVPAPFTLAALRATALDVPAGALALQVVGQSAHGGYPHRGKNPVPVAIGLLRAIGEQGLAAAGPYRTSFAVDLRLTPEMELADGRQQVMEWAGRTLPALGIPAHLEAPAGRCRGGYSVDPGHGEVRRLEPIIASELGIAGVYGEYGGTDASSLRDERTPAGQPLPAMVFGSMDRSSHIHEAEESVDPRAIVGVSRVIERFLRAA